jgi:hypothetical protein
MIAEAKIEGQKVHPWVNPYPSGEPYITPPDAPQPMYPGGPVLPRYECGSSTDASENLPGDILVYDAEPKVVNGNILVGRHFDVPVTFCTQ